MVCSLEGWIIKTRFPDFYTKRWKWFGPEVIVLVRESRPLCVCSELTGIIPNLPFLITFSTGDQAALMTGVTFNHYGAPKFFCFDATCDDPPIMVRV